MQPLDPATNLYKNRPKSSNGRKIARKALILTIFELKSSQRRDLFFEKTFAPSFFKNFRENFAKLARDGRNAELQCGVVKRKCGTARHDKAMQTFGRPDVRMFGRPDVGTSRRPDVRTPGRPDVRTSGRPDVRTSGRRDVYEKSKSTMVEKYLAQLLA